MSALIGRRGFLGGLLALVAVPWLPWGRAAPKAAVSLTGAQVRGVVAGPAMIPFEDVDDALLRAYLTMNDLGQGFGPSHMEIGPRNLAIIRRVAQRGTGAP